MYKNAKQYRPDAVAQPVAEISGGEAEKKEYASIAFGSCPHCQKHCSLTMPACPQGVRHGAMKRGY